MTQRFPQISLSRRRFLAGTAVLSAGLAMPALAQAKEVKIISNLGNAEQRAVLERLAKEFSDKTGTPVTVNNIDHEANKTQIRSYLVVGAPDICFWFSGNRMKAFVEKGLFDDISDLFADQNYKDVLGATTDAVTVDGKQYGLPMGGLLWGLFYRADVFEANGWTPPANWADLLAFGETAKGKGMTPIVIGTKDLWPAGGFFDHLSMRTNGLKAHIDLMDGKTAYTDASVVSVFDKWKELLDAGMFPADHAGYSWEPAAAQLAQKKAAMMDLAGFIKYGFPAEDVPQLRYAAFPTITDGVARAEDFSVNSIHVPANAANKAGAREFLAYFYQPENLAAFLAPEGAVPPRSDCPPSADPLVNSAVAELQNVAGTAQYYDRDTDPDMAQEGMKGFQEFMVKPERRDEILGRLEKTRERIFG